MARKKAVLIIVEGPTDEDALGLSFKNFFSEYSNNVLVEVMHYDITSEWSGYPQNIRERITNVVKENADKNKYTKELYSRVIHIVDTDGAFIDEQYVIQDDSVDKTNYSLGCIKCKSKKNIVDRNIRKRKNIRALLTIKTIWTCIPYSVYYMSCNLDHVLHNIQNGSDDEKENNAHIFAKKYKNDLQGFLKFISESDFSVCDSYKETWCYIQKGLNSLNRHTNLNLCFKDADNI